MRSCLRRLLSLSIVLVFAALFCSVGICGRVYAAKPDGSTTSGSGYDNYSSSTTDTEKAGSGKPWKSFGNDDIDETQHFLGTTDDNDIVIKTNNTEKARVTSEGNVGIGTDAPTGTLHVEGGIAEGAVDGTDITIKAQDGGPDGGAGGDIVLKPGTGSGFVTDDDGNPVQATDEDGSPLFEDDGNGNLVPVFIPNSGNVIIDGNLAPSSGHSITLGTPELRYSGIYLASWFKYDTDGLYFYYTADERTPVDYFHARFTVDATPYVGNDGWTYFNVDPERSGNFIISPDALFESPLGTEKLQVDGDVMSTGNVDAVSFTGDGSTLSGVVTSEIDPAFTASAASSITNAGSNQVITAAERTALGTALQSETDPTVDLDKLKLLAGDDFHALGGVDADTTRSDAEIVAAVGTAGYVSGAHTTKYTDAEAVIAVAGEHTVDTNTQLSEAEVDGFVANNNFSIGTHTVDTTLDKGGVEALGISITESQISDLVHTADTNTQLSEAEVDGFVANNNFSTGAHTADTTRSDVEIVAAVDTAGYVSGAHTADTTRSDAEIIAAVDTAGYVSGAHTTDTDTHIDQAGVKGLGFVTGTHTVDTDTQLDEAAVDAFVANNNFSTGAHTTDTKLDKAGIEALVGSHTNAGLWDSDGTSVYYNDGFVGIGTGAAVPGAELEVRGNIIANIPTADNHLATKAYVDAASGGGGCYVSYSGGCAAGFTSQGSAGTWGYCWNSQSHSYRPPGASECIHGGWNYTPKGAAYICCK